MGNNKDQIQFIPHHIPTLKSGHYRIQIHQTIKDKLKGIDETIEGPVKKDFIVRGERFELKEEWVHSVFPPENRSGDYVNCLPHIVVNRGTWPWERTACNTVGSGQFTWLALLVFDEVDLRSIRSETIPLNELDKIGKRGLRKNREPGEELTDSCSIISVPEGLLDEVVPDLEEMKYLAHIRKVSNEKKEIYNPASKETEYAVIIGNRLLESGKKYTAYLVSLENYYHESQGNEYKRNENWYAVVNGNIHLVYLKSWRFEVPGGFMLTKRSIDRLKSENIPGGVVDNIEELLDKLYLNEEKFEEALQEKLGNDEFESCKDLILKYAGRHGENFKSTLLDLDKGVFRCDKSSDTTREKFLQKGFAFLPHQMRQGTRTESLYRGPFIPYLKGRNHCDLLPVEHADKLIRCDSNNDLFEVSYAAAWQLGRLLSLQNRKFALSLVKWKSLQKQKEILKAEQENIKAQLGDFSTGFERNIEELEKSVLNEVLAWFGHLKLVGTLPLNYLVPVEEMLPQNSIRFFSVDLNWVDCLMDGAYSIARFATKKNVNERVVGYDDAEHFSRLKDESDRRAINMRGGKKASVEGIDEITGILFRSRVIVDWPGLEIDAYSETEQEEPLPIYTMQRLTNDILLCLFTGRIHRVDIHHPPEGMHFGVSTVKKADKIYKNIRDRKTGKQNHKSVYVEFRSKDKKIIDINRLVENLAKKSKLGDKESCSLDSGEFGLQMIESGDSVSFIRGQQE